MTDVSLDDIYGDSGAAVIYDDDDFYSITLAADTTSNGSTIDALRVIHRKPFTLSHGAVHMLLTSVVLGAIILATILGNVFVIAAIVIERNLRNVVANYLIASLAVADLMVAALVMPLAAVNEVSMHWFLGTELCEAWTSFDMLCCTSSILHLVAISLDRYWAVTRVDYIQNRSSTRILVMIAMSWAVSALISVPPLFGSRDPLHGPDATGVCQISQDRGSAVFSTVGAFYLPLVAMMIIYARVYRAARSRIRKQNFTNRIKKLSFRGGNKHKRCQNGATPGSGNGSVDEDDVSASIPLTKYALAAAVSTPPVTPSRRWCRSELTAIRFVLKNFNSTSTATSGDDHGQGNGDVTPETAKSSIRSPRLIPCVTKSTALFIPEISDAGVEYRSVTAADCVLASSRAVEAETTFSATPEVQNCSCQNDAGCVADPSATFAADSGSVSDFRHRFELSSGPSSCDEKSPSKRLVAKRAAAPGLVKCTTGNGLVKTGSGSLTSPPIEGGPSSSPSWKARDGHAIAREKQKQKRERKAARTLAIVTGTFVVCWLPFFIVALIQPFFDDDLPGYPPELRSVIGWLGYINSLLNPAIYTVFNPDFRSAFRKILFGRCRSGSLSGGSVGGGVARRPGQARHGGSR